MTVLILLGILLVLYALWLVSLFCITFVRHRNDQVNNLDSKANRALKPYRKIVEEGLDFIEKSPHDTFTVKSFDGLTLSAEYYRCPGADTTILLFHGYRSSAKRDFSCAVKMYCEMGMNVLLVDQRCHGKSAGRLITFGVKERRDVLSWIDFLLKNEPVPKLVLGGMSMGATTVLLAAGLPLPPQVRGIIADCGFTSPVEIISKVARQAFHLDARFVLPVLNLLCRLFGGFSVYGISTTDALRDNEIPVLFIHGGSDQFVPTQMSRDGFAAMKSPHKRLCVVDQADHGFSFLVDTPSVLRELERFLAEVR